MVTPMSDALNEVELVFVVDTTGSMGAFILATQRQMIAMMSRRLIEPIKQLV
jgi:hypothetical protein